MIFSRTFRPALVVATAAAMLLSGCTAGARTGYPSLAPRSVEKKGFGEPDPPAPVALRPDPALDAKIAGARDSLAKASAGFASASAKAGRTAAVAKGADVGSEAWLAAQTDLAELDGWRAQTQDVVSTLEDLAIARAAALAPAYPALEDARAAATAESTRQTARIDMLQATLPKA